MASMHNIALHIMQCAQCSICQVIRVLTPGFNGILWFKNMALIPSGFTTNRALDVHCCAT